MKRALPPSVLRDLHLVVGFTAGLSLGAWEKLGILQRETALYKTLLPYLAGITFITYGSGSDLRFSSQLEGIDIICNRFGLPERLYRETLPWRLGRYRSKKLVFKSNQMLGAEVVMDLANRLGRPFISRCGYLLGDFMLRRFDDKHVLTRQGVALEGRVFPAASHIVLTTAAMRQQVMVDYAIPGTKISVIPNYVDTLLFRPLVDIVAVPNRLIAIGRLSEQKNLQALFTACQGLDVELFIVGEGDLAPQLEAQAAELGLNVRFFGNLAHQELPALINSSAIYLMPSLYEGHPKTLLEAMACGCPVIAADAPGVREVIAHGETGYLCGTDVLGIKKAIVELLADRDLQKRVGAGARDYIMEKISLGRVVAQELGVLEGVLESFGDNRRGERPRLSPTSNCN